MQFSLAKHDHFQYMQKADAYSTYATKVELLPIPALTLRNDLVTYIPLIIHPYEDLGSAPIDSTSSSFTNSLPWWETSSSQTSLGDINYVYQALGLYWGPMPIYQYNTSTARTERVNSADLNYGFNLFSKSFISGYFTYRSAVKYFYDHILDLDSNNVYYLHQYMYFYGFEELREANPDMAQYISSSINSLTFSDISPFVTLVGYVDVQVPAYIHLTMKTSDNVIRTYKLKITLPDTITVVPQATMKANSAAGAFASDTVTNLQILAGASLNGLTSPDSDIAMATVESSADVRSHFSPRVAAVRYIEVDGSTTASWVIRVANFGIPFSLYILAKIQLMEVIT